MLQCWAARAAPDSLNVVLVNFGKGDDHAAGVAQGRFMVAIDQQAERHAVFRLAGFVRAAGVKNGVHGARFGNGVRVFQVQHVGPLCVS